MAAPSIQTEALWNNLHDRLGSFVRKRVGSDHDAEDVLQDIFVHIHERTSSVRDPVSIVAWVFTIARNAITDHYRARAARQGREGAGEETTAAEPTSGELENDANRELARCMRPFVEQLPIDYRRAVTLTDLDGLTHQKAAAQLGLSVSGAKSRVQRGRQMVRDLLLDCCEVELDRRKGVVDYARRTKGDCGGCTT